eukprot:tig00021720_g23184.t1
MAFTVAPAPAKLSTGVSAFAGVHSNRSFFTGRARAAAKPAAAPAQTTRFFFVDAKKVLVVNTESGGHAFIGDYLAADLVNAGHEVVFFKKGSKPATRKLPGQSDADFKKVESALTVLKGDPSSADELKAALASYSFDVVVDNNGKDVPETEALVNVTKHSKPHFIYVSSAGMYKTNAYGEMPHKEGDTVDTKSSKFLAEEMLNASGLPVTHIRPVYVYGALNYRDIEAWFFDRITSGRPVPIPGSGAQITNLGHVSDMSGAIMAAINKGEAAAGEVFNMSGRKWTTLNALAKLCAEAAGVEDVKIVNYDSKKFSFGKGKAFPLREKHFFVDTDKANRKLGWDEKVGLKKGLAESFAAYKAAGRPAKIDFAIDDEILGSA